MLFHDAGFSRKLGAQASGLVEGLVSLMLEEVSSNRAFMPRGLNRCFFPHVLSLVLHRIRRLRILILLISGSFRSSDVKPSQLSAISAVWLQPRDVTHQGRRHTR